ncbi:MAG TPA: DnaJ C-terminal domain-containing protein [Longimicrobiaceae bacterium]|nr:DnaJ C-terminal domain-containing protein [Longimicrobiaceae bacterium]
MAQDYYRTLGVARDASEKEIRDAYRRLARKFHPDVNPNNRGAEDRFKDINAAYEVLSDPNARPKYDKYGDRWEHADEIEEQMKRRSNTSWFRNGPGESSFSYTVDGDTDDLGSIFGSIFRGEGGRQAPRRGRDFEVPVRVTLQEAATGTSRMIEVPGAQTGEPRRIEVTIPPGVRDGSRVRVSGQGAAGRSGGPSGDLFLVVEVVPDSRFERRGDDLYVDITVPVLDAILGGEAEVPTLAGKVALTIPALTQNGRQFRLRGKGMPHLGSPGERGDLIARVRVRLPEQLSEQERDLYQQLQAATGAAAPASG